jgi:hypothetical protein
MNHLARRRLLGTSAAAAFALVAGLVIAPAVTAATNGLVVTPGQAFNNESSKDLVFDGTEADFELGGTATFTRIGGGPPFDVTIDPDQPPTGPDSNGEATADFTDMGNGIGVDGPADAGVYAVSASGKSDPTGQIVTGGNDTCASCFKIDSPGPIGVTSVAPKSYRPGQKGNVSILGSNFQRGTTIQFLFPDGSVDPSVTANALPHDSSDAEFDDGITTATEIKRYASVAAGASPGVRDVRVTNLDGTNAVCTACFFVSGASLTSISNPSGTNDPTGAPVTITFNGSNVTNGTPRLEFVGNPGSATRNNLTIVGTNVRDYTGTSITADFDLRNAAPSPSGYQPVVEGSGGVINACDCRFTVVQRPERKPTLTSLDSSESTAGIQKDLKQGETKSFTATGTNFSKGATLTFSSTGLTVTGVTFTSPEKLVVTIAAAADAKAGPSDATVVLTDGVKSDACAGCLNVVANASPSASPSASSTATASPKPSGSSSPSPSGCPTKGLTVTVNTKTINATGRASVTVTGATPTATIELQGYSQNHEGTNNFDNDPTPVDRTAKADDNGAATFNDLKPASNTRLRARQAGCTYSGNTAVIEVRAQETLEVKRVGLRKYTFSGRSIPARPGGLIVSLYRITGSACAAGVEPSKCPGETFLGQSRAVALGSPGEGLYSITITFPSRDNNVRDEFVVKTGRDAQNAPGRSNVRSLLIY